MVERTDYDQDEPETAHPFNGAIFQMTKKVWVLGV
jgi:hypothetical protein